MDLTELKIKTSRRDEFVDVTGAVRDAVRASGVGSGCCRVFVPHTTAAVTINEGADPAVTQDIIMGLDKIIPHKGGYAHMEGNSAAHIKASLLGPSVSVLIEGGNLVLGTWQAIYFCEFDGPRSRKALVRCSGG